MRVFSTIPNDHQAWDTVSRLLSDTRSGNCFEQPGSVEGEACVGTFAAEPYHMIEFPYIHDDTL
jgi:hypothetical protein